MHTSKIPDFKVQNRKKGQKENTKTKKTYNILKLTQNSTKINIKKHTKNQMKLQRNKNWVIRVTKYLLISQELIWFWVETDYPLIEENGSSKIKK